MTANTLVIAHRGASGYLPEHTLESKALAYGQGSDYLEQDVVATRDGELVVLHDLYLECVTDVAQRFPGRRRSDGHYYVIDFDLAELRQLAVSERRKPDSSEPLFAERFPVGGPGFRIVTLDEEINMIQGLNRSTGRRVGLYAEIKHPRWHADHGIDLGRLLLEKLATYGYRDREDPVFVQCFDAAELRRVRTELGTSLKLVQLVTDSGSDQSLLTADGLAGIADYAQALGPAFTQLVQAPPTGRGVEQLKKSLLTDLVRDSGLLLHPYTFRRDRLPHYVTSLDQLLEFFIAVLEVHGIFCDHPDIAVRVRDSYLKRHLNR